MCVPASVALSVEAHAQPVVHSPRQGRPQGRTDAQRSVGAGRHRGPESIAEPRARVPQLRQDMSLGRHVADLVREQPVQRLATMVLQRARLVGSRPGHPWASLTLTLRFVALPLPSPQSPQSIPKNGLAGDTSSLATEIHAKNCTAPNLADRRLGLLLRATTLAQAEEVIE
jgi:hypothetical protein